MARLIYSVILRLATPLILLRLLWRARRQPDYLKHWRERWGFYPGEKRKGLIWVHAVSVGETRAAAPLIAELKARFPDASILLTSMTPTGRATSEEVFGDGVLRATLPYDTPGATRRFLRHFEPRFGILMETEIWPNLIAHAEQSGVPMFLANARLSERSARGYQRFSALTGPAFASLSGVAAQTADDARRLTNLGAQPLAVCGNLKFDVSANPELVELGKAWRLALGNRPIWLAASTRDGEEAELLNAWKLVGDPSILLVIVPRHPQRFTEVERLLEQQGWRHSKRSLSLPTATDAVWLGDSMGEMPAYYSLADLSFVGGSLKPLGGQNLIEALACGCPVLVGPHTFNFSEVTEQAIACGAVDRLADAGAVVARVIDLLNHTSAPDSRCVQMKTAGLAFAQTHRGATAKTVDFILRCLNPAAH